MSDRMKIPARTMDHQNVTASGESSKKKIPLKRKVALHIKKP